LAATNKKLLLLLMLPAALVFLGLGVYPTVEAILISLSKYELTNPAAGRLFVGLANYKSMLADPRLWAAIVRAMWFMVVSVGVSLALGLLLALLLYRVRWCQGFFRIVFIVPMVTAPAVVSLNFKFMYNYDFGIINRILEVLHLPRFDFLGNPAVTMWSAIFVDIWQWTPLVVLVLLAGLESLPKEPFEAALIDGANPRQIFLHITLPMLKKFVLVAAVIRMMDALKVYETIQLMTAGGPGTASETLNLYIARVGFTWFDMGYCSALGIFTLYLITLLAWLLVRRTGVFGTKGD